MELPINPNTAYVLVVTAVMLSLWIFSDPKSTGQKVGLVVALSPFPVFPAIRQERLNSPLFLITILMLTTGSTFLFVDQDNLPVVSYGML